MLIIVPVRNEENSIYSSLYKLNSYLNHKFKKYQILVFNDDSTDGTQEILKNIKLKNLIIYNSKKRFGKGASISKVILEARNHNKIIFIDADMKGLNHLHSVYKKLDNCDIVVCDRYSKKSNTKRDLRRLLASKIYNFFVKLLLGSKFGDHQCGLKGFNRSEKLIKLIKSVQATHWFWDTELLVKAQWCGLKVCSVPIKWEEGKDTHVNLIKDSINMFKGVVSLFIERLRGYNCFSTKN